MISLAGGRNDKHPQKYLALKREEAGRRPGGMIGEKCTTVLILSFVWKKEWDFQKQSLMEKYCNMEAFS